MLTASRCRLCGAESAALGDIYGEYSRRWYTLAQCPACHFSFVVDPWTEYERIYDEAYYSGRGADPYVDYLYELDHPDTSVRQYEWDGILRVVRRLTGLEPSSRWLDFGCGNGGLVRHVAGVGACEIVGFEEGWISAQAVKRGIPLIDRAQVQRLTSAFDVVTAIEVLEHVVEPMEVLRLVRRLLRPDGLFFFTTGNARPWRGRLRDWRYVIPEMHVSYYEPESIARALETVGFRTEQRGFIPGLSQIIRFKALKNLGIRRPMLAERALPWSILARLLDARVGVTHHPIAWARS
jgi:SAM-dependent methyltransferase